MLGKMKRRRRAFMALAAALIVGALLQVTNTNPAVSQTQHLTAYEAPEDPGLDPDSKVWDQVSSIQVPLTAQAGAYAAGGGSVATARVEAVHYGGKLYVRVAWADATNDAATTKVEDFSDGAALEFPASGVATVPAICMGQADAAVNIWHWRADSNAGLKDPADVYASAQIDGIPFDEKLFYTAREAGNPYANPDIGAVQTLSARAFGELAALANQDVQGNGRHDGSGWAVVFVRNFETANPGHAAFAASTKTDMALAVWDGSKDERNGMKSVSQFVTLNIGAAPAYEKGGFNKTAVLLAAGLFVGVAALGIGFATYGYREGR